MIVESISEKKVLMNTTTTTTKTKNGSTIEIREKEKVKVNKCVFLNMTETYLISLPVYVPFDIHDVDFESLVCFSEK